MKSVLLCLALVSVTLGQTRGHSVTSHANAPHGWLGIGFGETDHGLEIFRVDENSPAARSGIKVGDVILEIGGEKAQDIEQVVRTIADMAPGQKLNLVISRSGTKKNITATLEPKPMPLWLPLSPPQAMDEPFQVMSAESPKIGIDTEAVTPQLAQYFGVKEGVLVRTVLGNTPAEKGGLKAGDVITKVDGTPVTSPHEISGLVRTIHATAVFTVMRNHKQIAVKVDLN